MGNGAGKISMGLEQELLNQESDKTQEILKEPVSEPSNS